MGIGLRLETLMKERHTNANELAQKIGVAPTTIYSMIKRDSKKADIDVLLKIARTFKVDVAYFGDVPVSDDSTATPLSSSQTVSDSDYQPSYDDMEQLIARNGKRMSASQKMRLIQLLSTLDEDYKG